MAADVNGDGVVNILDLVMVAGAFGNAAAPPSLHPQALTMLTATDVESWLVQAQTLDLTDATSQRGVLFLEQLLAVLTPKETALLPNYPNPFNPETWIPYRLAEDAAVTLTIYDTNGIMVRRLDVGHQLAGFYEAGRKQSTGMVEMNLAKGWQAACISIACPQGLFRPRGRCLSSNRK